MLIVSVAINHKVIDLICVHNTGNINSKNLYEYEIVNPITGKNLLPNKIFHKRSDGYRPLLRKVLKLLEKNKVPEIDFL
jgi:hypothetical protein